MLSRVFIHLLDPRPDKKGVHDSLSYLGISPRSIVIEIRSGSIFTTNKNKDIFFDHRRDAINELEKFSENFDKSSGLARIHISNLESPIRDINSFFITKRAIEQGAIQIARVKILDEKTKKYMYLSDFSSGQQCMLQIFLGIAGAIQDDSLVLIDEPEISLHPYWQSEIIIRLQDIFSHYRGCHFIIATHSPQVISDMTSTNGHVINIEKNQIFEHEQYALKSADFQLAEIFEEPGNKNEYLLRSSLKILTKLARGGILTRNEVSEVSHLTRLRSRIQDNDPVGIVIDQVLSLYD